MKHLTARIEELVGSGMLPESEVKDAMQALIDKYDPIVRVDRTNRPKYPDFVKEVKRPELSLAGPAEFDVTKLGQHLHPKQVNGCATGNEIYEELIARKILESCLGLVEGMAIQARGIGFYRKRFQGKYLPLWKDVVLNRVGNLYVPCLYGNGDEVELDWGWLDRDFDSGAPALRLAS